MEFINRLFGREGGETSFKKELCETILVRLQEGLPSGNVLKCPSPHRILIINNMQSYGRHDASFEIAVDEPYLDGQVLDVFKFRKSHGNWSIEWRIKDQTKIDRIEYPGIEWLHYEEVPKKEEQKSLSGLLAMIENSTFNKYV